MKKKVLIIGGGASGLMAAIMAAREGAEVTILEHMDRVGKKILSTGNGRCNMTRSRRLRLSPSRTTAVPHTPIRKPPGAVR